MSKATENDTKIKIQYYLKRGIFGDRPSERQSVVIYDFEYIICNTEAMSNSVTIQINSFIAEALSDDV